MILSCVDAGRTCRASPIQGNLGSTTLLPILGRLFARFLRSASRTRRADKRSSNVALALIARARPDSQCVLRASGGRLAGEQRRAGFVLGLFSVHDCLLALLATIS